MKRIAPIMLAGLTTLALISGCSSDTAKEGKTLDPSSGTSSSASQDPSATTDAPSDEAAVQQAVVNTLIGYMESMTTYTSADFEGFSSPDFDPAQLDQLIAPTLKYFYTGDLEGEELEGAKSMIAMGTALYVGAMEASENPEEVAKTTQDSIDSLRNDPGQVTITLSEDGNTVNATSTLTGPIDLVKVDGEWLISLSGLIASVKEGLEDSGGLEAPTIEEG